MTFLIGPIGLLSAFNAALLAAGRWIGTACVALMVAFILIQVFFRYVLNDAPAWTEEGARFLMLWMTGLMAPTAFRRGGFVSIDTAVMFLPRPVAAVLSLLMLCLSLVVLIVGFRIGWAEVAGFVGRSTTDSLWLRTGLGDADWFKVPKSWAMASLAVGITMLISVNVELILRTLALLFGVGDRLAVIADATVLGAE